MWAIRRTPSIALRAQTFSTLTFHTYYTKHNILRSSNVDRIIEPSYGPWFLERYCSGTQFEITSMHFYSSVAGRKSSGEEENDDRLEDGFSELEDSTSDVIQEKNVEDENDDDIMIENELSEEEDNDTIVPEENGQRKRASLSLFKAIMNSPTVPVVKALDNWLEKRENINRSDITVAMAELRRRSMYDKALQLSQWLESRKQIEFNEKDYASHVDLLAKTGGLHAAEAYIEKIPKLHKSEIVYQTLLANCVQSVHVKKAEEVFNKMKKLKFPITPFACNQLLLLYKRANKSKIADVLLLMEKENVKPTLFTYRLLIDIKGQSNDIDGMDQIVETMKAEGIDPDVRIQAIMARHYINGGLKEKAKVILQEIEGSDLKKNHGASLVLLPLYASLGSADDVKRVWEACKSNPLRNECVNAIDAWGTLNRVEEAEAVFDQMLKKYKKIPSKHYAAMLKVYASNKMLLKGKNLVQQMAESGCRIGPLTWDALVKLYVEAGEIEKADSILHRASKQNRIKPMFNTYMLIMDQYAKRGDIHNAEKMFHRMRQDGYTARVKQYHSLLQTYIKAKAPAYGIRERMKADNVYPNRALGIELDQVDAFKRNQVSDLLD